MSQGEAVIVGAEITGGHDGSAEMVVRLRYPGGTEGLVVLDEAAGLALMGRCGVDDMDGLAGHSWRRILETAEQDDD